jgi:hypothetical protein
MTVESWQHPWWPPNQLGVQYLYISFYLSDNKPVLSYLLLCLFPHDKIYRLFAAQKIKMICTMVIEKTYIPKYCICINLLFHNLVCTYSMKTCFVYTAGNNGKTVQYINIWLIGILSWYIKLLQHKSGGNQIYCVEIFLLSPSGNKYNFQWNIKLLGRRPCLRVIFASNKY